MRGTGQTAGPPTTTHPNEEDRRHGDHHHHHQDRRYPGPNGTLYAFPGEHGYYPCASVRPRSIGACGAQCHAGECPMMYANGITLWHWLVWLVGYVGMFHAWPGIDLLLGA